MASTPTTASRPLPSDLELSNEANGFSRDHREDWQRRRSGREVVRDAPRGPGLPAGLDSNRSPAGRFVKGHAVRSGGPRKRKAMTKVFREFLDRDDGVELARKFVARAVGCEVHQVPSDLVTAEDFVAWQMVGRAQGGSTEAFREIYDRLDPKPQKITLDASLTAKRAPISGSGTAPEEAQAAENYYHALNAEASAADEDEEYDTPEPAQGAGEDDLSFLE